MIEKIRKSFVEDTLKELEEIEKSLDNTKGELNQEVVENVFSMAHKIKGTAPMVGIHELDVMVFSVEKVFNELRKGYRSCPSGLGTHTQHLISAIKSKLQESQQQNLNIEDVNLMLRFFDSLISEKA